MKLPRAFNMRHFIIGLTAIVVVNLATVWLMWLAWKFVLSTVWPDGPSEVIDPDFVVYAGAYYLLLTIKALFSEVRR